MKEYSCNEYVAILTILEKENRDVFRKKYPELADYYHLLKILFNRNASKKSMNEKIFESTILLLEKLKDKDIISLLDKDMIETNLCYKNYKLKQVIYLINSLLLKENFYNNDCIRYYYYFCKVYHNTRNFDTIYSSMRTRNIVLKTITKISQVLNKYIKDNDIKKIEDIENLKFVSAYFYLNIEDFINIDYDILISLCNLYNKNKDEILEEYALNNVEKKYEDWGIDIEKADTSESRFGRIAFIDNFLKNNYVKGKTKILK